MEFVTLCMSPALDVTIRLKAWPKKGEVLKDLEERVTVGGKGINVARWLALRGHSVLCAGLLGEENRSLFERDFQKFGIRSSFLPLAGPTRRNEMITTPEGAFKLNRRAFPDCQKTITADAFLQRIASDMGDSLFSERTVWILSGSLPHCCPKTFYRDCILLLKERGVRTVLDTSGEPLRLGLSAIPDMIKPNAEECAEVLSVSLKTPSDFHSAIRSFHASGIRKVILSDGPKGAWFDDELFSSPIVEVMDTTAAGDTLLAEYCSCIRSGMTETEAARRAVAAGAAATTVPGAMPPPLSLVERLVRQSAHS